MPDFITALQTALPGAVTQVSFWVGDWTVIVATDKLLEVSVYQVLKKHEPAAYSKILAEYKRAVAACSTNV